MAKDPSRDSAGYSAALYHLFNHAFFKAVLFLGAGSVIHAVHTNDMRQMGGLSERMPVTSKAMLFGSLALAGIIPFSGFFSKGEILSITFDAGSEQPMFYVLYAFGVITAFLTAFYVFRLWFMTFWADYRGHEHPHESPLVMTVPLMILAGFALVSGLLAYPMQGFGNLVFFNRPATALPLVGAPIQDYLLEGVSMVLDRRRLRRVRPDRGVRGRAGPRLVRQQGHRRDRECGRPRWPRDRRRDGRVRPAGDRRRGQRGEL